VAIAVDVRVEVLFREADASPDLHGGDPALLPENSNVSFGGVEVGGSLVLIEERGTYFRSWNSKCCVLLLSHDLASVEKFSL